MNQVQASKFPSATRTSCNQVHSQLTGNVLAVSYQLSHVWRIEEPRKQLKAQNGRIQGPIFGGAAAGDTIWRLELVTVKSGDTRKIGVHINYLSELGVNEFVHNVKFSVCAFDPQLRVLKTRDATGSVVGRGIVSSLSPFFSYWKLRPRPLIAIACTLAFTVQKRVSLRQVPPSDDLISSLQAIRHSDAFSDFTLIASDGTKFPVHRVLLAGRSTVFAALFANEWRDAREGKVRPKVPSNAVDAMLDFVYTGRCAKAVGAEEGFALDLITLAKEYALGGLERRTEEDLREKLFLDTVCSLYRAADRFELKELKADAERLFRAQREQIVKSDSWREFKRDDAQHALELIEFATTNGGAQCA